jgi:hypothetical protein
MTIIDYEQQGTIGANLLPKRYDIKLYQGDTFEIILNFKDAGNVGVDLTGFTGRAQFKPATGAPIDLTVTTNYNATNGAVSVYLADTSALSGEYSWDLELEDAGGRKRTYIGGKVTITEDITEVVA